MAGKRAHIPLLANLSAKTRRKGWKRRGRADHSIIMEDDASNRPLSPRSLSPRRLDRHISVRTHYNELGDNVQARYTDELLQKVEAADYEGCEDILEADLSRASTARDEETQVTPLHVAAKNGQHEIMELLLKNNADCNAQDSTGQTPLHFAATKDHYYCCQTLLRCPGIQVNMQNKAHDTPLHHAAKEGRLQICTAILTLKEADVNAPNKKGMTPLHMAAQENHSQVVQLLIDKGANWKKTDKSFYLPLHYAAQKGYPDICEVLIDNSDSDGRDKILKKTLKDGKTPLMLAAKGGHHKCCTKLTNVNINARDKEGNTALHYAAIGGFENTVAELLGMEAEPNTRNKKGNSPIFEAACKKKTNCLHLLVAHGAKLDVVNINLKTVLHCAAEKNAEDTLRYLLSLDSMKDHLDQKDSDSCTPLHSAIKREAIECALILLEYGSSPTEYSAGGMTPLHLAAGKGYTGICEKLLGMKEVQVSQENSTKATPLHLAALHGSTDVCQMLIRKGARVTAIDKNGHTPLHVASHKGHASVVKFLSKRGVPQRAKDDTRSTALHLAASAGFLDCCQVLEASAKATLTEVDQKGNLPLDRAFDNYHDEVFKFLLQKLPYKGTQEDRLLRLHKYMHTALNDNRIVVLEAIIDSDWWETGFRCENGRHCRNFRDLVQFHPTLAHKVQDKCIRKSESGPDVTYDFRIFDDNYYVPTATSKIAKYPYKDNGVGVVKSARKFITNDLEWKKEHPLSMMVGHSQHSLLQHPLTNAWLLNKWRNYVSYIFLALLFMEMVFVASLNLFMAWTDNWSHIKKMSGMTGDDLCQALENASETPAPSLSTQNLTQPLPPSDAENNMDLWHPQHIMELIEDTNMRFGAWVFLVVTTSLIALLEINFVYRLRREYFYSLDHLVRTIGIISTILVIIPTCRCNCTYYLLADWQWQSGVVALLVAWLHLINTLNQLPMLSVFMPITRSFTKSFLKVLLYILMLVFVFAFLFHLLLQDHKAFHKVPQAMVKTIVWMLGDLAYDDMFLEDKLLYPVMVNCLFVVFVTTLGGFLVNLAVTQPSEKLDNFRSRATYHRAASRCMLFLRLDVCFPYFQTTLGLVTNQNKKKYGSNFLTRKLLMLDAIDEEKEPEHPLQKVVEEQSKQMGALIKLQEVQHDDIRELKHQLNALIKAIPGIKPFQ